jgi:hypothetical protein
MTYRFVVSIGSQRQGPHFRNANHTVCSASYTSKAHKALAGMNSHCISVC